MGILHQGYALSTGSDADSDTEGGMSPEHAIRLWGRGIKSRRSSGLSSRENSALTLTDSDNENKSDDENEEYETIHFLLNRPCRPTLSQGEETSKPRTHEK
ncbi:Teneurin-2 [Camelus dromedarius]|uniref:Teneurin-2 n=1 Tax=Camelus dromedarius TaxID=9838 RepID=A0A5N4CJM2_CAMDR|nr:Teneurin-2 [Camelus dromedarius]